MNARASMPSGSVSRAWSKFGPAVPGGGGAIALISATRPCSASGRPMWKSAPSGPAIASRKNVPTLLPVTRRTTSPTSQPKVTAW